MTVDRIEKRGLIVWLYTLKNLSQLKKYGFLHYSSEKMKYAVLYVDESRVEEVMERLNQLHYVRSVEISHMNEVDMTFADAIPKADNSQEDSNMEGEAFFNEIAKQIKEMSMKE